MKKIIVIFFTLFTLQASALELRLGSQTPVAMQEYTIVVAAMGKDVVFDDVQKIGGYRVESVKEFKNTLFINNEVSYEVRLVLTIVPEDDFLIEPISAVVDGKRVETKPQKVSVDSTVSQIDEDYFILMEVDKTRLYVNEPLMVTVQLWQLKDQRLLDIAYHPPSTKGFYVKQFGDEVSYTKGKHIVHELNYFYYPDHSGSYTIDAARARIGVPVKARDIFGETFIPQHYTITTDSVDVEVKPVPEGIDLVGQMDLEYDIETTSIKENEPIYLDLRLYGDGNFHDFLGFDLDIDGVSVFGSQEVVDFDRYEQSFSLIASDDFTIPKIEVRYFNPYTKQVEFAIIEAVDVTVATKPTTDTFVEAPIGSEQKGMGYEFLFLSFILGVILGVAGVLVQKKVRFKRQRSFKDPDLQQLLKYCDDKEVYALAQKLYDKEPIDKKTKKEIEKLLNR